MTKDEAIARLREHEADLKNMGVMSLYLFGSTARGEARPESDVDLFFEYDPDLFGLLDLVRLKRSASELLGCNADVMTRSSIDPYVRPRAEADAVQVF
jgi:predicted nucleotidyltransferase